MVDADIIIIASNSMMLLHGKVSEKGLPSGSYGQWMLYGDHGGAQGSIEGTR